MLHARDESAPTLTYVTICSAVRPLAARSCFRAASRSHSRTRRQFLVIVEYAPPITQPPKIRVMIKTPGRACRKSLMAPHPLSGRTPAFRTRTMSSADMPRSTRLCFRAAICSASRVLRQLVMIELTTPVMTQPPKMKVMNRMPGRLSKNSRMAVLPESNPLTPLQRSHAQPFAAARPSLRRAGRVLAPGGLVRLDHLVLELAQGRAQLRLEVDPRQPPGVADQFLPRQEPVHGGVDEVLVADVVELGLHLLAVVRGHERVLLVQPGED